MNSLEWNSPSTILFDHWSPNIEYLYILISFSSLIFSLSLSFSIHIAHGMYSHSLFSPLVQFLSLYYIDLIYSHIESSPAAAIGKDRHCNSMLAFFFKTKNRLRKIDLTAISVWAIEQTIADPCWLWGWIVRSAFSLSLDIRGKCLTISAYSIYSRSCYVWTKMRRLNNTAWALWWSMWIRERIIYSIGHWSFNRLWLLSMRKSSVN